MVLVLQKTCLKVKIFTGFPALPVNFRSSLNLGPPKVKCFLFFVEVGMRFKAWHNKSNIIHCVVKIYQWWKPWLLRIITGWKSIHYFACGLETPLNTTVLNLARTWIMYKISRGKHHVFMTKPIGFCLGINSFWVRVSSLP